MKNVWNWIINLCLLAVGISFLIKGINNILHFDITSPFNVKSAANHSTGYNIGYIIGYITAYFSKSIAAIAFLYLFYERVFSKK